MAINAKMLIAERQGDRWVFRAHVDTERVRSKAIEYIDPNGDGKAAVVATVQEIDPEAVLQAEYMVPVRELDEPDEDFAGRVDEALAAAKADFAHRVKRRQDELGSAVRASIPVTDMDMAVPPATPPAKGAKP